MRALDRLPEEEDAPRTDHCSERFLCRMCKFCSAQKGADKRERRKEEEKEKNKEKKTEGQEQNWWGIGEKAIEGMLYQPPQSRSGKNYPLGGNVT